MRVLMMVWQGRVYGTQFLKLLSFDQIRTNIDQNTLSRKTNSILQYVVLLALTGFMSTDARFRLPYQLHVWSDTRTSVIQTAYLIIRVGHIRERILNENLKSVFLHHKMNTFSRHMRDATSFAKPAPNFSRSKCYRMQLFFYVRSSSVIPNASVT